MLPQQQPRNDFPEVPREAPTSPKETEPDYSNGIGTGDINADGVIDIVDATLIQKAAAGLGNLTAKQLKWCDFDFDGKITIADATSFRRLPAVSITTISKTKGGSKPPFLFALIRAKERSPVWGLLFFFIVLLRSYLYLNRCCVGNVNYAVAVKVRELFLIRTKLFEFGKILLDQSYI